LKKGYLFFLIIFLIILSTGAYSQSAPDIIWQKVLGGSNTDSAAAIVVAPDGGYIVAGDTYSNDGDVNKNHGMKDIWVVKLDSSGNIIWQKVLGGSDVDSAAAVAVAPDGGYIVLGNTYSKDGDVRKNHGEEDLWVVKLDKDGNIIWQRTYGRSDAESAKATAVTPDGGYIVAGWTGSKDGDVSYNHGANDFWVLKIDKDGNPIWQKALGGSNLDIAEGIVVTQDGGCVVAGWTRSDDGDVSKNHGMVDVWIIKLDKDGNVIWKNTYGGSDEDYALSIIATKDDEYIFAGWTQSNDGDVSQNHSPMWWSDAWVVKLDKDGNLVWQKALGGSNDDVACSVAIAKDSGYIIAGYTESDDGDVRGWHKGYSKNNQPYSDAWIIMLGRN